MLKKAIAWAWWPGVLVGIPLIVGAVGRALGVGGFLGPFLFASPFIAFFVSKLILTAFRHEKVEQSGEDGYQPPSSEMDEVAARIARLGGVEHYRMRVWAPASPGHRDAVSLWGKELLVFLDVWAGLEPGPRDFAMARAMVEMKFRREHWRWVWPAVIGGFAAGCALSVVNLWLILPAHAAFVTGVLLAFHYNMDKVPRYLDREALALTGDVRSAITYVSVTTPEWHWHGKDKRLAALQRAAEELGLAA